jgi:DnaJ-class molecular chaperone
LRRRSKQMANKITCERCAGSGEIGRRNRWGSKEAPGPVPDDARGWVAVTCPDCHGEGVLGAEDELEDEEG